MPNPILDKITVNDIEYDLVGNGGGHVIEKSDGTDMTQRLNLQFVDAQLTDDSTNDRTKVENVKIIQNESELANLPDGIYMGAQDEAVPFSFEAEDISYDNTTSQLEATDVQAAIDELSQKEAGVQSDWNEVDDTKLDYIKNKPANLVQDASYVHTDNNYTSTEKTKLGTIAEGAEVNVQSDWSQTDNTADDYIKNKPTIPDAQIQSDWNQTSGTAKDFIKNKPTLGTASALDVATSGDASATQVVKGDDSRLSDARTPVSHTHTLSEITDAGTAASKNSTSSVTAGSTDLVESGAVKTAIDNAVSGAYKHAGTKTCAELISNLLIPSNNGNVYNITDSGTTTADFIEGAGIPIRAGDNVGIAKISDSIYKFDLLSGFIDTSNFVTKSSTSGLIKNDGSIDTTEYAPVSSVPAAQIQSDWSQSDNTKLDYIKNKPTLGTAAAKNVPSSGDAGNSEVVLGNDSRLTDARNAADVYSWAKAENKPSYTKSEVGLGNVDNTSDVTKKSNFTGSIASGDTGFVTGGDAYSALGNKVDKIDGKGLSTNDYTTTEKNKLAGIASGAEVNVQSDWNQTTTTADDYIKNKPANLVQDASYVHTDNNYTSDEKTKLSGIAAGAEVNVQSDWDETDDTQDDYIKNKPEAYDAIWQNNNILEGISDKQPYLYRATSKPEGAIEYVQEKLIGASAAVNQLVENGNFSSDWNWSATNASLTVTNNIGKFVANAEQGRINSNCRINNNNHKWLAKATIKASSTSVFLQFWTTEKAVSVTNAFEDIYILCVANYDSSTPISYPRICDKRTSGWDEVQVKNVQVIDLTQMFGTAIADLAYSKEQASAGSGIAWLKSYGFFTKDYYPYNTGALQSVKTGSKKVVGKNLFDEVYPDLDTTIRYKFIYVGDGTFTMSTTMPKIDNGCGLFFLTGQATSGANNSTNGIHSSQTRTITSTDGYVTVAYRIHQSEHPSSYKTQIELGSTATSYEPYTSTTYPLDSDLELRGLYKLDANNNIVCDGDEYSSDGSVKRRYGIVDLGSLNWYAGGSSNFYDTDSINVKTETINMICSKYPANTIDYFENNPSVVGIAISGTSKIRLYNSSYSSASDVKTAMSGVYLIYELATETTDTAASYQNPQIIHENGTEEFIDTRDYPLPVGHDTGYFTASDEKFFLPPVVDNDGRFLYHDSDGFQFKNFNQVASKVEESDINGNIKIDGTETQVYDDSELQGIVDTDTTVVTGNPLNFSTKSAQNAVNTDIVIDPVQDLHGFTKPWVGGAGKNLLPMTVEHIKELNNGISWNGNSANAYGITFTILTDDNNNVTGIKANGTNNGQSTSILILSSYDDQYPEGNYILTGCPSGGTVETYMTTIQLSNEGTRTWNSETGTGRNLNLTSTYYVEQFYIEIKKNVSVSNIIWYPMLRLSTETDSSFAPYTNICPISGYDEVDINGCGENLLPLTVENIKRVNSSSGSWSGNAYTLSNTVFTLLTKENSNIVTGIKVSGTSSVNIFFNISDRKFDIDSLVQSYSTKTINNYSLSTGLENEGSASTYYAGYDYTTFKTFIKIVANYNPNNIVFKPIMSYDDPNPIFEPYTESNNISIQLSNTVYGGKLDVEKGELVVTHNIFDIGDINWTYDSTYTRFVSQSFSNIKHSTVARIIPIYSTCYESIDDGRSVGEVPNGGIYVGAGSTVEASIYINDYRYTSASDFTTGLAGQKVCYELASPFTIKLTPHQINLLKGVNTITTNADSITLQYRNGEVATLEDLKILSDNLIAHTEDTEPYGFIEHMSILDPAQRIEYIGKNKNYSPMTINLAGDHLANYNEWYDFPVIKENKPYMIKADGTVDYALDPNDYTKKFDGSASDVANTSYTGGAFAWIPKTYKREFTVGDDRYVYISTKKLSDEYEAIGFIDENGLEHDGAWIPMFYGTEITQDGIVKIMTLATGAPTQNRNTDTQKTYLTNANPDTLFFGGAIVKVLTDIMIMLGKNSDVQAVFGTGNMSGGNGAQYMKDNACINGGAFYGTTTNNILNKAFHSLVLLTQNQWQRDPYTLNIQGEYIVSPYYKYDLTGDSYVKTGVFVTPPSSNNWVYPNKSVSVPHWGAEPVGPYSGSTTTGWTDSQYTLANQLTDTTVRVVQRFANCGAGRHGGLRAVNLTIAASDARWSIGASPLLLSKGTALQ